jgi:hypothetical protein
VQHAGGPFAAEIAEAEYNFLRAQTALQDVSTLMAARQAEGASAEELDTSQLLVDSMRQKVTTRQQELDAVLQKHAAAVAEAAALQAAQEAAAREAQEQMAQEAAAAAARLLAQREEARRARAQAITGERQ